jgi:hypothetical protein
VCVIQGCTHTHLSYLTSQIDQYTHTHTHTHTHSFIVLYTFSTLFSSLSLIINWKHPNLFLNVFALGLCECWCLELLSPLSRKHFKESHGVLFLLNFLAKRNQLLLTVVDFPLDELSILLKGLWCPFQPEFQDSVVPQSPCFLSFRAWHTIYLCNMGCPRGVLKWWLCLWVYAHAVLLLGFHVADAGYIFN